MTGWGNWPSAGPDRGRGHDPDTASAAHLAGLGLTGGFWAGRQGAAVDVLVMAQGVDLSHPDLAAQALRGWIYATPIPPAAPDTASGTALAELVAGTAGNGIGGRGVAPAAGLGTLDLPAAIAARPLLDPARLADAAFDWAKRFDVVLHIPGLTDSGPGAAEAPYLAGWRMLADAGRAGLGAVVVAPRGSGGETTINVAPIDRNGQAVAPQAGDAGLSGGGVLVSAFDAAGYRPVLAQDAAAAQVAGVVALMLGANPRLGWRDVAEILAVTARHTGPAPEPNLGPSQGAADWQITTAAPYNAGLGLHYSADIGFGLVDARAALRLAESLATLRAPPQTSANQITVTRSHDPAQPLADAVFNPLTGQTATGVTEVVFQGAAGLRLDSARLSIHLTHSWADDLRISLIAPDGTRFALLTPEGQEDLMTDGWAATFLVAGTLGMSAPGEWRLRIEDLSPMDSGTLGSVSLQFAGRAEGGAQIVTDAIVPLLAARGGALAELSAAVGPILNLAALSAPVMLVTGAGGMLSIAGQAVARVSGDFAVVHLTDGHDILQSAATAPVIAHGGRGRDTLAAGSGDDTLYGGQGRDDLAGGDGGDRLHGGSDGDTISGQAGADQLFGDDGADLIFGGAGDDRLWGGQGDDTLSGGAGRDTLAGAEGADHFVFARGFGIDLAVNLSADQGDRLLLDRDLFAAGMDDAQIRATLRAAAVTRSGGLSLDFGQGDALTLAGRIGPDDLDRLVWLGDWL